MSNMLKYINLNEQYPENNNICMTDLSREIVKIHNGKKFVYKKFKNVKDEILTKEDAILIKKFYLKILSEINRVD